MCVCVCFSSLSWQCHLEAGRSAVTLADGAWPPSLLFLLCLFARLFRDSTWTPSYETYRISKHINIFFEGIHLERRSPQGDLRQEAHASQTSCPKEDPPAALPPPPHPAPGPRGQAGAPAAAVYAYYWECPNGGFFWFICLCFWGWVPGCVNKNNTECFFT